MSYSLAASLTVLIARIAGCRIKANNLKKKVRIIQTIQILGLGIDISKKNVDVCIKHSEVLERFAVSNDEAGISELLERLEPYKKDGVLIKAAMESTGNLWMNMFDALQNNDIDISYVFTSFLRIERIRSGIL
ncbi:MAG: transposase [Nitrososphaerales archaeon]